MKREVILYASSVVLNQGNQNPTSTGYLGGSPKYTLDAVWKVPTLGASIGNWATSGIHGSSSKGIVGWDAPPTLVLFTKVTIQAIWDYCQHTSNNWYFPPTNAFGPRLYLALRKRDKSDYLYSDVHEIGSGAGKEDWEHTNFRLDRPGGGTLYTGPITSTWEMVSHPEGGVFSPEDMSQQHLAAGVKVDLSNPAFVDGNYNEVRVYQCLVKLEVEDLGGEVRQERRMSSIALRIARTPRDVLRYVKPVDEALLAPGDVGFHVWNRGPHPHGKGWDVRPPSRRPAQVFQRKMVPGTFPMQVEYKCLDGRSLNCLAWGSFRTSKPWSPEYQGLAWLDLGGGFGVTRDQDAWAFRPGDGVLLRVLKNYMSLSEEGTPVEGGGDIEKALYNSNPTATGWTQTGVVSGCTLSGPTGNAMVEELGYQVSGRLDFNSAGTGKGGWVMSSGVAIAANDATKYLNVRVGVRNINVVTPGAQFLEFSLSRTSGGTTVYYRVSDDTWQSSEVFNALSSAAPYGEVVIDHVSAYVAGQTTATYKVKVGRFSSGLADCSFVAALASIQEGTAAAGCRSPLVTLGSTATRVATVLRVENPAGKRVWGAARGTCVYEFRPGWKASVVGTVAATKPLVYAFHSTGVYDRFDFVTVDGSTRSLRFRRRVGGVDYDVSAPVTTDLSRAHIVRTWARWLDDDGWEEWGPYTLSVGFAVIDRATSAVVEEGQVHAAGPSTAPTLDADAYLLLGSAGSDSLDGSLRWWETTLAPLWHDECVWRR